MTENNNDDINCFENLYCSQAKKENPVEIKENSIIRLFKAIGKYYAMVCERSYVNDVGILKDKFSGSKEKGLTLKIEKKDIG